MTTAYTVQDWSELFVASAGASAALTGLLFVAVSVNVERILEFHLLLVLPGTLPLVIGAVSVLAETGGGLYWIVAGIIGAIFGASVNAWVLLVEILR